MGNSVSIYNDFNFNQEIPNYFKKNQIKNFQDSSFLKTNKQWNNYRPIDLKENETEYVSYTDSLREYYQSEEYALKQDSSYNKITFASYFGKELDIKIDIKDILFTYGQ